MHKATISGFKSVTFIVCVLKFIFIINLVPYILIKKSNMEFSDPLFPCYGKKHEIVCASISTLNLGKRVVAVHIKV